MICVSNGIPIMVKKCQRYVHKYAIKDFALFHWPMELILWLTHVILIITRPTVRVLFL